MTNAESFAKVYAESFKECYPQFDIEKSQTLIEKAIETALKDIGTVSIDGAAFKMTFKKLGIKPTYKAIREYLGQ